MPFDREPLGRRLDGTPFWGYLGAEGDDPDDDPDDSGAGGDGGGDGGGDDLRDEGRRAIAQMREDLKRARDAERPWRALSRELGVKNPDEVRALLAKRSEDDTKHAEELRRRDEAVLSKANKRILRSEIKALAADGFADASDAVQNLNLDDYEVDDEGNVPERRIKADLADLLKRKPHLAKRSRQVDYELGPRGNGQGSRGKADMNTLIRRAAGRER